MMRWLKRVPLARAVWDAVRPKSHAEKVDRRDGRLTRQILRRVLTAETNCIDVGAHAGDVLAELVRLAPRGRHLALEPIAAMAATLCGRFPAVEVQNVAAGDRSADVTFQVVETNPAFSGMVRRPDLRPGERVAEVTVRCEPLDWLVPAGRPVGLIKVDVEGAEMAVFRGAARVLAGRPWVLFEHGAISEQAYGATTADVHAELARHRLGVWTLGGWVAGAAALSADGFAAAVASGDQWNFLAGPGAGE